MLSLLTTIYAVGAIAFLTYVLIECFIHKEFLDIPYLTIIIALGASLLWPITLYLWIRWELQQDNK